MISIKQLSILNGLLALALYGSAAPPPSPLPYLPDDRLELRPDLIEGDILPNIHTQNGIRGDQYRWPNRTVPYEIDTRFNSSELSLIFAGWAEIENTTCIRLRFREPSDRDYVIVQKGSENSGCFSEIGRVGRGQGFKILNFKKILNFEPRCLLRHGTIIHEMLHAIGFYHEQSRPDRDDYVTVVWDKIEAGMEHNFYKYTEEQVDTMGTPYDYGSVLHYPPVGFSIDGSPTIIPKDPDAEIGQRIKISEIDAYKVNVMYNCTEYL